MSSISIKTGFGRRNKNNKRTQKQAQQPQATQTFPVFGLMALIMVLGFLGLLLLSQPSANTLSTKATVAPQTLSISGAFTSRIALEDAAVQCTSTGMTVNGTSPMPYSLNYAMGSTAASQNLSLDGNTTLSFSINGATAGVAANTFTAYEGVVYAQNGRNYVNAFLTNDSGQPLYINAVVNCI